MQVILLQDVPKVGRKFDTKQVSDGFATNWLFPRGLARQATPGYLREVETLREQHKQQLAREEKDLAKILEQLKDKTITLKVKANEKGGLFAHIHEADITKAIQKEFNTTVLESAIEISKSIDATGEHEVMLKAGEKKQKLILSVEAQ